jgi:hypothetical protein
MKNEIPKPSADVRAARQEIVENLREWARYYYGMDGSTATHVMADKIEREMMDYRLSRPAAEQVVSDLENRQATWTAPGEVTQ